MAPVRKFSASFDASGVQPGLKLCGRSSLPGAWQSYTFHDISTSNDATPLWLPELAMAVGSVVFAIAFVDELVLEIRGRRVVPVSDEATRNE